MRLLIGIGTFLALTSSAYTQHRGGFATGRPAIGSPMPPTSGGSPGFGGRPGPWRGVCPPGVVRPGAPWWRYGANNGFGFNRFGSVVIPYVVPYPAYFGNDYYPDTPSGYWQQPPNATMMMPPQEPAPPVVINQYGPGPEPTAPPEALPDSPAVQTYQAPVAPRPEPAEPSLPTFFIALKDGWVYTTSEYWVENGTLHYITAQGKHNQVSLGLVDRPTTERLNEGRDLRLPPR